MTAPIRSMMLVDDNRADLVLYRIVIERSGLVDSLESFIYAEDALEHLKRDGRAPVDAILLDINMPRMSGFEFLDAAAAQLRSGLDGTVVAILTTSLNPRDLEAAGRHRAVRHYFDKPLTEAHLQEIVAGLAA